MKFKTETDSTKMHMPQFIYNIIILPITTSSLLILSTHSTSTSMRTTYILIYTILFITTLLLHIFRIDKLFTAYTTIFSILMQYGVEISILAAAITSILTLIVHKHNRKPHVFLAFSALILIFLAYSTITSQADNVDIQLTVIGTLTGIIIHKTLQEYGLTQRFDNFTINRPHASLPILIAIPACVAFILDTFCDSVSSRVFKLVSMTLCGFLTSDTSDAVSVVVKASGLVKGKPKA